MPVARYNTGNTYGTPGLVYGPAAAPPATRGKRKMSTKPVDDVIGYAQEARELLISYQTEMTAAGVDPTALIAALATDASSLTTKNQEQEAAKTTLRNLTAEVDELKAQADQDASHACDLIIGAFGKADERAREATKLRKSVNPKRKKDEDTPPPTP